MSEKTVTERIIKVGELTKGEAKDQIQSMAVQSEFLTTTEYYKTLQQWVNQED